MRVVSWVSFVTLFVVCTFSLQAEDCTSIQKEIEQTIQKGPRENLTRLYKQLGDCYAREQKPVEAVKAYQEALAAPFTALTVAERLEIARYLAANNNREIAFAEVEKILSHEANNSEAVALKAELQPVVTQLKKSESLVPPEVCGPILDRIAEAEREKSHKKLSLLYKELGDCYQKHDKGDLAVTAYEQAFSYQYGVLSINDRITMAEYIGLLDHYDSAIAKLEAILKDDPKNLRAQILLARYLSWSEQYQEAEQHIEAVLAVHPKDREALLLKANILNGTQRSEQAITIYKELLDNQVLPDAKETFDIRYGLVEAYIQTNKFDEAAENIKALKPELPYQKARLEKLVARAEKAKEAAVAAKEKPGKSEEAEKAHKARMDCVRVLVRRHCYKQALSLLCEALLIDPKDDSVRVVMASVLGQSGRVPQGLRVINGVICRDPKNYDAWIVRGSLLRWIGAIPASTAAFNHVLRIDCKNFDARVGIAWTHLSRDFRGGAYGVMSTTRVKESYEREAICELADKVIIGPILFFQYFRYKDSDDIITDDYFLGATYYKCDWKYNVFYNHVHASQPVSKERGVFVRERSERVKASVVRQFSPWFDVGAGLGYARIPPAAGNDAGNFAIGHVLANIRTNCGLFFLSSEYDLFTATAAALFFKIRTWFNTVEYFKNLTGQWTIGARYIYAKYSDANHAHKAQIYSEYLLINAMCWNLYIDYLGTYWDFESQPVSPFVVAGIFGGHGYFDPQRYWASQVGATFVVENRRIFLRLRPYVAYATYHQQGIHYYGFFFAGIATLNYYFTPRCFVGGSLEGGRYPLKHLKYNYSIVTARVSWAF